MNTSLKKENEKRLLNYALSLGSSYLFLSIGSIFLGKYIDNRLGTYPEYTIGFFFISFIMSGIFTAVIYKRITKDINKTKNSE